MSSPYAPGANKPVRVMASAPDVPAISQDGLRGGIRVGGATRMSASPAFGSNGELNATSNKELMQVIAQLVQQSSEQTTLSRGMTREAAAQRQASLVEAFNDRSGEKFSVLGEVYSDEILN